MNASSGNIVHDDENWRQRLRAEQAAAGQWRDSWGFLEHAKPPGAVHVDRQIPNRHLTRTIAEQGIMYPFMLQTYREQRDGTGETSRFNVGGSRPQADVTTAAGATKQWRGDPDAPRWNPNATARKSGSNIVSGATTARSQHSNSLASTQSSIASSVDSDKIAVSPPPRPTTPVLHLDLALAKTLLPKTTQLDVGGCVQCLGVDPNVKYRTPLTASHRIGWNAADRSLEFFGVAKHGLRNCSEARL